MIFSVILKTIAALFFLAACYFGYLMIWAFLDGWNQPAPDKLGYAMAVFCFVPTAGCILFGVWAYLVASRMNDQKMKK